MADISLHTAPHEEAQMIETILLITDGSAPAERAAHFAASLATCYKAKVIVLHAFDPLPSHLGSYLGDLSYSEAIQKTLGDARSLVLDVAKRLHELGVTDVETEVLEGPAVSAILSMVEARKPDLLVMGARGLGTWQGIILGSVSMAITQRAECPVLVVK
jgi:nucleotide-binding universal stress UspA family protein